jgi:putative ABC transport system ATP-binding protein
MSLEHDTAAPSTAPLLGVRNLRKTYASGNGTLDVLKNLSFDIERGSTTAIVGPSGSGKTTLLGLLAGLDQPTGGTITLDGIPLQGQSEDRLAEIRNRLVGFVFQSFQLIPTLTALENVMVPLELRGDSTRQVRERAADLLERVGLGDRTHHYPTQLSGGEQQRVGIARGFIHHPKILFADEPTGNLDSDTSLQIEELLFNLNRDESTTLVIVTHDLELAAKCERIIRLRGGEIVSDEQVRKP